MFGKGVDPQLRETVLSNRGATLFPCQIAPAAIQRESDEVQPPPAALAVSVAVPGEDY
jgi:hypothetical protein